MLKRTLILVFVLFIVTTVIMMQRPETTFAETCATTNEVVDPAPFQWTYVSSPEPHYMGVLEYGEATFNINGETLTTRAYRQEGGAYSIPGPTLHMKPGNKYVLHFRNLLPYQAPAEIHNDFKDANITNVHTHGLHISGESPGDDVTRLFEGGYGGDYVYDIPADHMGGTFWYHAHHHGSTFLQVSTGGFGFIIVDDSNDQIPTNVAAMVERHILIGYLDTNAAGTGGDALVSGTLPAGWTVNGARNGDLCVPPDTWQHWRVLLADRDARTKDVSVGANCEVKLLARDGVWRTTAPKDIPDNTINLTGASRADLAVRCSGNSEIRVGNETVANVLISGTSDPGPHPYAGDGVSTWSAARPSYLRDLRGETNVHFEKINMGARTVNGSKFDPNTPIFRLNADSVQEWSIKGAGNHPFHLHVYHFQAQDGCGGDFEAGEYYDTMAGNCAVRFDLNAATSTPYAGMTIMHCHILEHEDQGAMTWMDVIGGIAPPTFPSGLGYSAYYALSGSPPAAPSNLTATAVDSGTIDLSWVDNATDESGFNIERSLDGTTFTALATVGADEVTYRDSGLNADTTYWYRVNAENDSGPSAWSNTASATTPAASDGSGTAVTVGSLSVTVVNVGHGHKRGQATVVVVDDLGQPVEGATVTGDFSGSINEQNVSGPLTDATGTTIIETQSTAKGGVSVTFCVTSITHPSLTSWAGEVCASS
ncbi:MAG: multicopper oxidase domain-containing protein [Candidatus Promineifilaceae bacterium]|nr:multicopper oxidase domain-containing protein [Candidatus Promineifilaceae bacterium]